MNLKRLSREWRTRGIGIDKEYLDKRSKEIDQEVMKEIEFEKRWKKWKNKQHKKLTLQKYSYLLKHHKK